MLEAEVVEVEGEEAEGEAEAHQNMMMEVGIRTGGILGVGVVVEAVVFVAAEGEGTIITMALWMNHNRAATTEGLWMNHSRTWAATTEARQFKAVVAAVGGEVVEGVAVVDAPMAQPRLLPKVLKLVCR